MIPGTVREEPSGKVEGVVFLRFIEILCKKRAVLEVKLVCQTSLDVLYWIQGLVKEAMSFVRGPFMSCAKDDDNVMC